jgi:hypothetical protein
MAMRFQWTFLLTRMVRLFSGHENLYQELISIFGIGFNSIPLPFPVEITPRSATHVAVIEREFEEAQEEFKMYEQ